MSDTVWPILRGTDMIKKIFTLIVATLLLVAVIPASVAASEDVQPYNGWIGADSPLYGMKLWFQGVDESLSGNANAKMVKQMAHAQERLSEAQAMGIANKYGAMDAALCEYDRALVRINQTLDDPTIDNATCENMSLQLQKHQNHFQYMVNNSSLTEQSRNRWMNSFNYSEQFKNGRPFTYANNTSYFQPPGHANNGKQTDVPPGLASKGYLAGNGSTISPGDGVKNSYNNSYDYNYDKDYNNSYNNSYNNTYMSPGPHGNGGSGNGKK